MDCHLSTDPDQCCLACIDPGLASATNFFVVVVVLDIGLSKLHVFPRHFSFFLTFSFSRHVGRFSFPVLACSAQQMQALI